MRHPRRALLIGATFIVDAAIYWVLSYDAAGTAALGALGVAMGVMSFALAAAAPDNAADPDAVDGEAGAGQHGEPELHG